ncbi:hydrogenase expression/formation protein HypE [Acidiferrobacter sp. SPIII_3]|uniref:hydrogenase expression/formation protein HypE n=1 Tax=Acidiferrobacter sp. SPIII_3 TaxID=1281578 RepID=UPI000D72AED9|nr:hydrogenase expression/formation protein HypE [Acidiferrobacter sp. SPIII_3]AWP23992.1 hydrogenase expression/formation protein HypE [Acidiferrobacter sp. SPIII_3]
MRPRGHFDWHAGRIDLTHGSGGRATTELVTELFVAAFAPGARPELNDGTCLPVLPGRLVMATDSHVISPLFFPGGDIGSLAVHGTINDLAMMGATPRFLSVAFILEEGLLLADLRRIVESMAHAARCAGVSIVTGDTKVVERGKGDGVFVTTAGIGFLADGVDISGNRARAGDRVLVSGSLGDHGAAILASREGLQFETTLVSDSAPLNGLVADMIKAVPDIHCLRDATRGGLAAVLNELAHQSGVGIRVDERVIPVKAQVKAACELLGLDPLYLANEGKLVAVCRAEAAEPLLDAMRSHPLGADSRIIGEVFTDDQCFVEMDTVLGGRRVVDWLAGDPLPRIC